MMGTTLTYRAEACFRASACSLGSLDATLAKSCVVSSASSLHGGGGLGVNSWSLFIHKQQPCTVEEGHVCCLFINIIKVTKFNQFAGLKMLNHSMN